jgi:hypothetical protein
VGDAKFSDVARPQGLEVVRKTDLATAAQFGGETMQKKL